MSQSTEEETRTEAKPASPVGTQEASDGDLNEAVAKAVEDMFALKADAWRPKTIVKFVIDLPSGQRALVKHLDILDLAAYNLVETLDFFMRKLFPSSIDQSGNPVEEKSNESLWQALGDINKRKSFLGSTGKLIAAASISPKIVYDGVAVVEVVDEETGNKRKVLKFGHELTTQEQIDHFKKPIDPLPEGAAYAGYIGFGDRIVFFQELNKPLGMIEPFREGSNASVQDLARSEGPGGETE